MKRLPRSGRLLNFFAVWLGSMMKDANEHIIKRVTPVFVKDIATTGPWCLLFYSHGNNYSHFVNIIPGGL